MIYTKIVGNKKLISGIALDKRDQLQILKDLVESGALKPTIDRTYSLNQIQQAHAYADTNKKTGSIVITVEHDENNEN